MKPRKKSQQHRQLTPRQLEILTRIRNYKRNNGYSPTMQELADAMDISKVTVFEHVDALVAKGMLQRFAHKARSLELTSDASLPDERPTRLPLMGRIAAGMPIEAIEDPQVVDLEELFVESGDVFVLRVSGDSMIEEHIREGDFVVVRKAATARNGETVVALIDDGEATLKKFYREKGRIRLQPANEAYEPIYTDNVNIQGVVIGVIRRL